MSLGRVYARKLHEDLVYYYAQWLPTQRIELGTVGILEGHLFRPQGTLQDLGISFDPATETLDDLESSPLELVSSKGVTITTKLAGETNQSLPSIPQASAGIGVEFSSEAAFVIKGSEMYEPRIRPLFRIEKEIKKAYNAGTWKKNYAVVFSKLEAPHADIIISKSSNSKLELQASVTGGAAVVELGNAQVTFSITRHSGAVLTTMGAKDVTPAFQLMGLKHRGIFFYRKPTVGVLMEDRGTLMADGLYEGGEPADALELEVLTGAPGDESWERHRRTGWEE